MVQSYKMKLFITEIIIIIEMTNKYFIVLFDCTDYYLPYNKNRSHLCQLAL